jgi:hypothetical protein
MTTAVASRPLVEDLLLVRLLAPTKRPPAPCQLRKDLEKLTGAALTPDKFTELLGRLGAGGLVVVKPARLTEKGKSRALDFLGVDKLPPKVNWKLLQARYLAAKALGFPIGDAANGKRLRKAENLVALLLKQQYQLPAGSGESLTKAMNALACRELGFPEEATLEGVMLRVLSRFIGAEEKLPADKLKTQLPRVVAGTSDSMLPAIRQAVIRRWASGGSEPQPANGEAAERELPGGSQPSDFDLAAFAATVAALARNCSTGRFGNNKVFISSVYQLCQQELGVPRMTLPEFKVRLVEANRQGLLQLSRADLVQAMDPVLVRESEADLGDGVTFHFILVPEVRP